MKNREVGFGILSKGQPTKLVSYFSLSMLRVFFVFYIFYAFFFFQYLFFAEQQLIFLFLHLVYLVLFTEMCGTFKMIWEYWNNQKHFLVSLNYQAILTALKSGLNSKTLSISGKADRDLPSARNTVALLK